MHSLLSSFIQSWQREYTSMKLDLSRMRELAAALGHPELSYPSILIAGTNGKGSVGRMLESVLRQAGYRVGLYSSPHLVRFNERIRVDAQELGDEPLEEILRDWQQAGYLCSDQLAVNDGEALSWFEKITSLAFEAFRRQKVDIALLEVGLGGRLDATNIADPLLSIITSIGFDHTEVLGDSIFEIAREKAGVMRPHRPVVIGWMEEKVRNFLTRAARILEAEPITPFLPKGSPEAFFYRDYMGLRLGLRGEHQLRNAAIVLETLEVLRQRGFAIPPEAIRDGLAQLAFPGRLEYLATEPQALLDGAHNVQAMEELIKYLAKHHAAQSIHMVLGMMREKKALEVLKLLAPLKFKLFLTEVDAERSLTISEWKRLAALAKIDANYCEDSAAAWQAACRGEPDLIVATGSLYLLGELKRHLGPAAHLLDQVPSAS